ncbi:Mur ligase domain-containing protein [Kitasatospora sp. NPDC087314]|uniref:Mur ligase domain-containing protein n=1 Tax=Kitasatospora sp. NPDC087314 TaxID=3364068 RepID=UPI0037FE3386
MDAVSVQPRANGRTKPTPGRPDVLAKAHLVDAAKPGMEGLALWLAKAHLDITGSIDPADLDGAAAARLREAGVSVLAGFDARNVRDDRTCAVWPGAVAAPHPELDRAQELRLPVLAREHALASATAGFSGQLVAVGGSHGTATAAAVLAAALDDGHTGWILNAPSRNGAPGHGGDRRLVVDLCPDATTYEAAPLRPWSHRPGTATPYRRPHPSVTLITSASRNEPHFEDIIEALNEATCLARSSAAVVLPLWDKGAKIVHERISDRPSLTGGPGPTVVTVGLAEGADVWVLTPRWLGGEHLLTLHYQDVQHQFTVPVIGRHHALAACAALATALVAGEDPQAIAERVGAFRGVQRSLAVLGTQCGITVVDSRARHAREIAQDVTAARMLTEGSVLVALEPDGLARTSAHADELGAALGDADHVLLLPVSTPLTEHDGPDPLDAVERAAVRVLGTGAVHRVRSGPCEPGPEQRLAEMTAEGDLVLVVGTGQAQQLGPRLLDHLPPTVAPGAGRP